MRIEMRTVVLWARNIVDQVSDYGFIANTSLVLVEHIYFLERNLWTSNYQKSLRLSRIVFRFVEKFLHVQDIIKASIVKVFLETPDTSRL